MENLPTLFVHEAIARLDSSIQKINHCLIQLNEDNLWWRPSPQINSIGVLLKHILGSFRQWTIVQITNAEDMRHRPDEFLDGHRPTRQAFLAALHSTEEEFTKAIKALSEKELIQAKRIQGYDTSTMAGIFRALLHVETHVGQMILLTRLQKPDYRVQWIPQNPEQKAERK